MASYNDAEGLGKRTARVLSAVLIGQALNIVVTAITIILIARLLGPADYGIYIFAFGFATLIDSVGGLGIGSYLNRHLSISVFQRDHQKTLRVLSSGYFLLIVASLLLTVLALSLSGYLSNTLYKGLGIPEITLITSSFIIFFVMVQAVSANALIGLAKGFYSSFSILSGNIVQLFASVLLVIYGFGVEGALAGMLIGYAVSAAIGTFLIFHTIGKRGRVRLFWPTSKELKETAKFSLPIGINNMLNDGMQNFSILFLGFYVTASILGNYGAALRGLAAIILLQNSINHVLLPAFTQARITKRAKELHLTYNKVLGYSLVVILPLLVYTAVFSAPAVYLFLSKGYALAPGYLTLIMIGTMVNTVSLFISSLIVSIGRTTKVLKYYAISAVIQLASLVLLTQSFLVYGSIAAIFIIGNIASIFLFMRGAISVVGVKFDYRKILMIFVSNVMLAIALAALLLLMNYAASNSISDLVLGGELLAGAVAAALLYPIIFAVTGTLARKDIEGMRVAAEKLPFINRATNLLSRYSMLFIRG
jgi:O-antigen/teichoic acid export membrane protein